VALDVEHGARAVVEREPPPGEEFGEAQDRGQVPHGVPDRRQDRGHQVPHGVPDRRQDRGQVPHGVPDRRQDRDVKNLPVW